MCLRGGFQVEWIEQNIHGETWAYLTIVPSDPCTIT